MAAVTPGLAAAQASQCEVTAGCCAVLLQRLQSVGRTGGLKTARRTQPRAEEQPIRFDQRHEQMFHDGLGYELLHQLFYLQANRMFHRLR